MLPSHPAFWQDSQAQALIQAFSGLHGWLLAGWLVFSLLVIAVVDGGGER